MRAFSPIATAVALLTLLSACHQASPLVPGNAQVRQAGDAQARSVAGRVLVKWKAKAAAAKWMQTLRLGEARSLDAGETQAIELPAGMSVEAFRQAAGADLEYAEPDYIFRAVNPGPDDAAAIDEVAALAKRKAPAAKAPYALKKVRAAEAWQITRGSADIKIAVVDTGADLGHPALRSQIVGSTNVIGWRGKLGLASAKDDNGHGTHCAGVAAASANAEGVSGMAPGCKLLIAKALGADGAGATSDIVRGIRWAASQGADVISLSVGGEDYSAAMRDAVKDALASGIVVVAAMGNEGKTLKNYPAAYPGVIAVGATNAQDKVSAFSTRGSWISVAAPGANILSTTPTYKVFMSRTDNGALATTYGQLSGTSMATPLVAGVAALIKSKNPRWTPAQVKKAIERSAVPLTQAFNTSSGHGRVDAAAALR
jgi:thermitase